MLDVIREKVANAERISDEEGLFLLSEAELLDLAPDRAELIVGEL